MTRLGAKLHPIDANRLARGVNGLLLADERWLARDLGHNWLERVQQPGLKGIVFSPDEVLRTRLGPARWWRLGLSPLYPDLLLESGRELLCGVVNPVMATHADKLSGRVLVADDHPVNRALLERQLGILGVECVVVENGEQALQAWQAEPFSLLLTDCHMPVMDGYTLTSTLRANGDQAPIIGVTADTSEEASARMVAAGMNGMLIKPYMLEALRQTLVQWLPTCAATAPEPLTGASALAARWMALFGDEEDARAMASEYLASNLLDREEMMAALAVRNGDALLEIAHRIKGAARMVGECALAEQAELLESAARLKQLDEFAVLGQEVDLLINRVTYETGLWLNEQARA